MKPTMIQKFKWKNIVNCFSFRNLFNLIVFWTETIFEIYKINPVHYPSLIWIHTRIKFVVGNVPHTKRSTP